MAASVSEESSARNRTSNGSDNFPKMKPSKSNGHVTEESNNDHVEEESNNDHVEEGSSNDHMEEENSNEVEQRKGEGATKSIIALIVIFVSSALAMAYVYYNFPDVEPEEAEHIRLPKSMDDAKLLGQVLSRYKDKYYYQVLGSYFITYVFLQSFAIPGSIFLSILSGFLFNFYLSLFMVSLCSALGASFCYLLSFLVGHRIVWAYCPERARDWSSHVERHRDHLVNYIIFLRITPFLPNWFINIASPVINVPLTPFFMGTFLGVMPPSFIAITAGQTLQQLTSTSDTLSVASIAVLAGLALVALLPVVFKNYLKKKFD